MTNREPSFEGMVGVVLLSGPSLTEFCEIPEGMSKPNIFSSAIPKPGPTTTTKRSVR